MEEYQKAEEIKNDVLVTGAILTAGAILVTASGLLKPSVGGGGGGGGVTAKMGGVKTTVTNSSGAPLPGSTVIVQNPADGVVVARGTTDGNGIFDTGLSLQPGTYTVQATNPSYQGAFQSVNVQAGIDSSVTLVLPSGPPPQSQTMLFQALTVSARGASSMWQLNPNAGPVTAAAFVQVQNSIGQVLAIGVSALQSLSPGQSFAFSIAWNVPGLVLPPGSYTATTFIVNQNNASISNSFSQAVII